MAPDEAHGGETGAGTGSMGGGGAGAGTAFTPFPGVVRKIIAWRMSGENGSRRNAPAFALGSTKGISLVRAGVHYDITPTDFVEGRESSEYTDTIANESGSGGEDSIFTEGGYRYHVFELDGTFEVFAPTLDVDVLIVGGGAGCGVNAHNSTGLSVDGFGGGGGAGAARYFPGVTLEQGPYDVEVGAGGAIGVAGGDSSFAEQSAAGGGPGGTKGAGGAGGCGGGGGSPQYPSDGMVAPFVPYDNAKYDHASKAGGVGSIGGNGGASGDNDPGSASYSGGAGGGGGMGGGGSVGPVGGGVGNGGTGVETTDLTDVTWHDFGMVSAGGPNPAGALVPHRGDGGDYSNGPIALGLGVGGMVVIRYPV